MSRGTPCDWEAVERLYRAGLLSLREIAKHHGVTEGAIRKRAKKEGWARDLTARVQEQVRSELVRSGTHETTEQGIVEEAAKTVIALVREHRKDIGGLRGMAETLSEQLGVAAGSREELEVLIREETAAADDPDATKGQQAQAWAKRNAMLKAIALPAHAGVLKDLATVLKSLIPLERQAFNVDAGDAEPERPANEPLPGLAALLGKLDALVPQKVAA